MELDFDKFLDLSFYFEKDPPPPGDLFNSIVLFFAVFFFACLISYFSVGFFMEVDKKEDPKKFILKNNIEKNLNYLSGLSLIGLILGVFRKENAAIEYFLQMRFLIILDILSIITVIVYFIYFYKNLLPKYEFQSKNLSDKEIYLKGKRKKDEQS